MSRRRPTWGGTPPAAGRARALNGANVRGVAVAAAGICPGRWAVYELLETVAIARSYPEPCVTLWDQCGRDEDQLEPA